MVVSTLCAPPLPPLDELYIQTRLSPIQVTLIPGDGIGNEITQSVKDIFEYVNAPIEWEQYNVSGVSSEGEELFKQALESLRRNRVGLKGEYAVELALSRLLHCFLRYPFHPDLPVWPRIMERRHASTA